MAEATKCLYERLGGAVAVKAAVDVFYGRVLADQRIARFFASVDMIEQKAKQRAFLAMVFGGPKAYSGRDMTAAHAALVKVGLDDSHVDAVVEHLGATLEQLGVPAPDIQAVLGIAESVRGAVLGRG